MNEQLVRRLDRQTLVGSTDFVLELVMSDKSKSHFLFRVGGICMGLVAGTSKFGDWKKLVGRFKAQTRDGSVFVSGKAFLPGDGVEMIAAKFGGEDIEQVSFLFDVYARYDSALPTKYGYIIEPVRKPDESDPLDALFNEAKPVPALEAPKADKPKK